MKTFLARAAAVGVIAAALAGCGGGGGGGGGPIGGNPNVTNPLGIASITMSPSAPLVAVGSTVIVTALAKKSNGTPVAVPKPNWSWASGNTSVATITTNGDRVTVRGVAQGTAVITVTESSSGKGSSVNVTVGNTIGGGTGGTTSTGGGTTSTSGGSTSGGSTSGGSTSGGSTSGGTTTGGGPGIIYSNDFESTPPGSEWSLPRHGTTPTGRKFLGEYDARSINLSLPGLAAHSSATVSFDLYMIRSWDGNSKTAFGPDPVRISADGASVFYTTFSNVPPNLGSEHGFPEGFFQSYPDEFKPLNPSNHPYGSGAAEFNSLGYMFRDQKMDSVYKLSFTIPHVGSALTLNWLSVQNQDILDESWGLDNVVVSIE